MNEDPFLESSSLQYPLSKSAQISANSEKVLFNGIS